MESSTGERAETSGEEAGTWAVVLAGGSGTRFWPASTPERPKQLLPLGGDRPLVAEAVSRARAVAGLDRLRIVAGRHLLPALRHGLPTLGDRHFLAEPRPRGTGPALAWAAHEIARTDPGAVMVAMHADHVIRPEAEFLRTVRRAVEAARSRRRLYCIGAPPDRPETGYGYLELGEERAPGVHDVRRFVEKPDRETAARYLAAGDYLWNTGIFVWRVDDFLEAVGRLTPEVAGALPRLDAGDPDGFFETVKPITVDVGVMERSDAVGAVRATFAWDDVGVWTALARTRGTDAEGNTTVGPARLVESADNIVWAEGGRVTLFGVRGFVVVRSGEETLVMPRERAPGLKRLLRALEAGTENEDGGGGSGATGPAGITEREEPREGRGSTGPGEGGGPTGAGEGGGPSSPGEGDGDGGSHPRPPGDAP